VRRDDHRMNWTRCASSRGARPKLIVAALGYTPSIIAFRAFREDRRQRRRQAEGRMAHFAASSLAACIRARPSRSSMRISVNMRHAQDAARRSGAAGFIPPTNEELARRELGWCPGLQARPLMHVIAPRAE